MVKIFGRIREFFKTAKERIVDTSREAIYSILPKATRIKAREKMIDRQVEKKVISKEFGEIAKRIIESEDVSVFEAKQTYLKGIVKTSDQEQLKDLTEAIMEKYKIDDPQEALKYARELIESPELDKDIIDEYWY